MPAKVSARFVGRVVGSNRGLTTERNESVGCADELASSGAGTRWCPGWLADAIEAGGGEVVAAREAEALVWAEPAQADKLDALLRGDASGVKWVQLPWAGSSRTSTSSATIGSGPAARGCTRSPWPSTRWRCCSLVFGASIAMPARGDVDRDARHEPARRASDRGGWRRYHRVVRCGCWRPSAADVTVVRQHPAPMAGVRRVVGDDELHQALDGAVGVVLALALTPETAGIIGRAELDRMNDRRLAGERRPRQARRHGRSGDSAAGRLDRRRGPRRDRAGTIARRPSLVVAAELHHHTAHGQHAGDGAAACSPRASPRTSGAGERVSRSSVWSIPLLATDAVGLTGLLADADSAAGVRRAGARRPHRRAGAGVDRSHLTGDRQGIGPVGRRRPRGGERRACMYFVVEEAFATAAQRRRPSAATSEDADALGTGGDADRVLRAFVRDGRLAVHPDAPRRSAWWCSTAWPRSSSPGGATPNGRSTPSSAAGTTTPQRCVATSSTTGSWNAIVGSTGAPGARSTVTRGLVVTRAVL